MSKEKNKVYLYTRVSTLIQVDGYSLDAQKSKMKAFCEYNDYEIAGEYEDAGKSGKSIEGRIQFNRMLEDIKSGKDGVSYVLVFKLSRFGRNAADVLSALQIMQDYDVNSELSSFSLPYIVSQQHFDAMPNEIYVLLLRNNEGEIKATDCPFTSILITSADDYKTAVGRYVATAEDTVGKDNIVKYRKYIKDTSTADPQIAMINLNYSRRHDFKINISDPLF